jgi:predicted nucleic acid-binding protein
VTLGEFAEGFTDPQAFGEFIARFRVIQLSRGIAWRAAMMQCSLPRRLGENDAWIAATALAYDATLVGRDPAFARVPRLSYVRF